jgi:hypothetical protein
MKDKGMSSYISAVLVFAIGMATIYLVLAVIKPTLDKTKDTAIVTEAFQNIQLINTNIKEVVSESEGSKRTISLRVTEGTYTVDSLCNCINFTYNLKSDLSISGQRNDVNITRDMNTLNLFIKYNSMGIQGSDHFSKGINSVIISHNGINTTTNYSMIYVGK